MSYYNPIILKTPAKVAFFNISWLDALIRIPIVFFRDGLNLLQKSLLVTGLLLFFWLLYLLCCIAFHRLSLKDENKRSGYLSKDDLEKGKEVGTYLEGW